MDDDSKTLWMKKRLEEIFDDRFNLIEERYQYFKKRKNELKREYIHIFQNCKIILKIVQMLVLEKTEYDNRIKNNINSNPIKPINQTIILQHKIAEQKPLIERSRTPNRMDYNTNNTNNTKTLDRSKTPIVEKTNLIKLNRIEKNLINDLKNPKSPIRTKIEKPSEKTPVKVVERKDAKSTSKIPNPVTKSPLNETKKQTDKKTPIRQLNEKNGSNSLKENKQKDYKNNEKHDNKATTTTATINKNENIGRDKNKSVKNGKNISNTQHVDKLPTKINATKVEIQEDKKNKNVPINKETDLNIKDYSAQE